MEKQKFVDQRRSEVDRFVLEHGIRLAQQGTIVATFRQRNGRRVGPYFRLTCRAGDGRQVSVYLGTDGPVVAEARRRLGELQQQRQQQRRWTQVRQAIHREMKAARRRLEEELAKQGLTSKGAEIRGWQQLEEGEGS